MPELPGVWSHHKGRSHFPSRSNKFADLSQRCKAALTEGNAIGSGGAVGAASGWGTGNDTAVAGGGEASWGGDSGGGGW